jgi:hypothetical protein
MNSHVLCYIIYERVTIEKNIENECQLNYANSTLNGIKKLQSSEDFVK